MIHLTQRALEFLHARRLAASLRERVYVVTDMRDGCYVHNATYTVLAGDAFKAAESVLPNSRRVKVRVSNTGELFCLHRYHTTDPWVFV